jgi:bifunctional DNA-binding transcriptional regulator/antitoxin component of YhaV-PrlF toxin-antitoxin module
LQLPGEFDKKCPKIGIIRSLKNLTLKAEVKVVTITSQETDVEIQQFPILLGQGGEITIPQLLQDSLNVNQGDMLVLLQIGNLIVLAPKQPQAPQLIDRIATIMESENVGLTDLLAGLEAEREAIWQEKHS